MWAMLAAPLMVSEDLISMSSATHTTVTNKEAIAIDQDPAGQQARLLSSNGSGEVWVKPLASGRRAVALLNRSSKTLELTTSAAEVGMPAANAYQLRNVWTGAVTSTTSGIGASVPGESTVLLEVSTAAQAIEAVPKR
jgi:alpha-galactosidase